MTTERHQPSSEPWTVVYSPYTLDDGSELPAYEVIADEKVCDLNESMPPATQEANAYLIAASWDLLTQLIRMVETFAPDHESDFAGFGLDHFKTARHAIAKAKGGAQ